MSRARSHASSSLRNVNDGSTRTGRQTSTSHAALVRPDDTSALPHRSGRVEPDQEVPVVGDARSEEIMLKLLKVHYPLLA